MAALGTPFPYGHDLFGDFQLGSSKQYPTDEHPRAPPLYYPASCETQYSQSLDVASLSPPLAEIASESLARMSCVHCRGRRYDYTAYFHNTKIFVEPPHELLKFVEESYVQKNRLQSLLINYGLRDIQQDSTDQIKKDLELWETQVHNLAMTIGDDEVLEHLRSWASNTMKQLWEHVVGTHKMDLPPGRAKELASEFRKLWEAVWIKCILAKGSASRDHTATN